MGVAESPYSVGERLGLTEDETGSITRYVSSDSYKINDKLRNNLSLDANDMEMIKNLDSALEKLPNYEGVVYRSVNPVNIGIFMDLHQVGKPFRFKAYTSSGTKVYDERFSIQYIINSKNGKDIRAFNEDEAEILFRRNTWFWVDTVNGRTIYMTEL
jgi:hypothetical protein